MALTINEKLRLDNFMCRHIDNYLAMGIVSIPTIHSDMDNEGVIFSTPLKLVSLQASCRRINKDIIIKRDGHILTFTADKILKFKGKVYDSGEVVKEKNIFYLTGYEDLQYDVITKKFNIDINNCKDFSHHYKNFENVVNSYEWIFNYQNDYGEILDMVKICEILKLKTMPKGLVKELNNCPLTEDFLLQYILKDYCGKYFHVGEKLYHSLNLDDFKIYLEAISWVNKNIPFESFIKMIKNELLSESYNTNIIIRSGNNMMDVFYRIGKMLEKWDDKEPFKFNFERSLTYNCNAMEDYTDREKNKRLATKLQKFNFINDLKINDDKYIVVVPQSQADKREEARQQNNCVGYYYDDYVLSGKGAIYFVRKADNKNHSFITCRYDYRKNKTVEARYVNNNSISTEDEKIIKNLDEIIRKKLNEKRKEEN